MNLTRRHLFALAAISLLIFSAGCSERNPTDLEAARATIDPVVFDDDYSDDAYFQPFFQTHYTAASLDSVYAYGGFAPDGDRSLKFNIPPIGSALGPWTGGVITSSGSRDLADFNALTFYARANNPTTLDVAGFGNDNTGNSLYEAGRGGIVLSSEWTFIIIPIPSPSKLIAERGLFTFAEAPEFPDGYDIWVDEIRFANLGNITNPRSNMGYSRQNYFVGSKVTLGGDPVTTFDVDGVDVQVGHSLHYFDYFSDDPTVAKVEGNEIFLIGAGTATVTAKLDTVDVDGYARLTVYDPPAEAAPAPTLPSGDVISMFSDVYNDVPIDTWRTDWSSGGYVQDYVVAGDNTKMYTELAYVGIEFKNPMIDATEMTHIHLDIFAPEGSDFKFKMISFPSNPDIEKIQTKEIAFDASSVPPFTTDEWISLDIPFSDLEIDNNPPYPDVPNDYTWDDWDWAHIGEFVISTSDAKLILVDNVYWHK